MSPQFNGGKIIMFLVWFPPCCTIHPIILVIYGGPVWDMVVSELTSCQGWPPLQWKIGGNSMGRNWKSLSLRTLAPGRAGGQVCALAMCCPLLSSVMPDHALGLSYFPFLDRKLVLGVYGFTDDYSRIDCVCVVYCPCTTVQSIYILNWFSFFYQTAYCCALPL